MGFPPAPVKIVSDVLCCPSWSSVYPLVALPTRQSFPWQDSSHQFCELTVALVMVKPTRLSGIDSWCAIGAVSLVVSGDSTHYLKVGETSVS